MTFLNHDAAFRGVRSWLVSHDFHNVSAMKPMHKGRHCIISSDEEIFYCVFKHEFFLSYARLFQPFLDHFPNLSGYGESLNVDIVRECFYNSYTLLFVYENEAMYSINPGEILSAHVKALSFMLNGLIRSQDKTNTYKVRFAHGLKEDVNEATYSFPVKMLRRINN